MEDSLRFSVAYWHTLVADGTDQFGVATVQRQWSGHSGMNLARTRVEAAFELIGKLGLQYFAFHDRDIAPEATTLADTNRSLPEVGGNLTSFRDLEWGLTFLHETGLDDIFTGKTVNKRIGPSVRLFPIEIRS